MNYSKNIKLLGGPLIASMIFFFCDLQPGHPEVTAMAAVTAWMAFWWLTEVVHLAVTALLPVVLLPMLGISDSASTATQYMDPIIFLFIGGFIIAFAIERWQLHQRIALRILMMVGSGPSSILFGVMLTSFLISMWISNTATVMMLISAVMALILQVEKHFSEEKHSNNLASALLIGLAYSASIGGMATLVGTPTNMIFYREYTSQFPNNADVNFLSWFKVAFPVALAMMLSAFFVLRFMFIKRDSHMQIGKAYFRDQYNRLGKMSYEEKVVGLIFCFTAVLWFTRETIDFGAFKLYGWSNIFPKKTFLHDSTVAVVMAVLLFIIPSKTEKGRALMTWNDVQRLPFDIVLLFGGGFALANGFKVSGLSAWLGSQLQFSEGTNIYLLVFVLCLLIAFISEFSSNVACIQLMIPIIIAIQQSMGLHPLILLVPATLASSIGFMLPVATAPNTIVFGSKRIRVHDMMKTGFVMDIIGVILITISIMLIDLFR
jgi:sodium-dependent dicarboxylate transporter 2/3/5